MIDEELTGLNLWVNQEYCTCELPILKRDGRASSNFSFPSEIHSTQAKNAPIVNKIE